jgi:molybdate transport system regulatory protein
MNAAALQPLVQRRTGGRGGGATQLTPHGVRLLERFEALQTVHRRFVRLLEQGSIDLERDFSLLDVVNMRTSARNQFVGQVTAMRAGAVNDEVELTLPGGTRLVAQVTRQSTATLGLRTGLTAIALIKSSSVMLATGLTGARLSARNQLPGTVVGLTPGAVNTEVAVALANGDGQIVAIADQASVQGLALSIGTPVTAVFDASSIIVAVID